MNTETTEATEPAESMPRRLRYWLRATDALLAQAHRTAFERADADQRTWRLLNMFDRTPMPEKLVDRLARKGKRLRRLIERDWIAQTIDGLKLTDKGRAEKDRLNAIASEVAARVAEAVPAAELEATLATLKKLSGALGWEEGFHPPRTDKAHGKKHADRRHHRHGHHRGHGHGFRTRGGEFGAGACEARWHRPQQAHRYWHGTPETPA